MPPRAVRARPFRARFRLVPVAPAAISISSSGRGEPPLGLRVALEHRYHLSVEELALVAGEDVQHAPLRLSRRQRQQQLERLTGLARVVALVVEQPRVARRGRLERLDAGDRSPRGHVDAGEVATKLRPIERPHALDDVFRVRDGNAQRVEPELGRADSDAFDRSPEAGARTLEEPSGPVRAESRSAARPAPATTSTRSGCAAGIASCTNIVVLIRLISNTSNRGG